MAGFAVARFGGLYPIMEPRKLPNHGATTANDSDLEAGDLRTFSPLKDIAFVSSSLNHQRSGFVFNEDQMFVFDKDVDASYGPVRVDEEIDNRVFLSSGFRDWPSYSTKRLGLPNPSLPYHGPPINFRKLGVIEAPGSPGVSVDQPASGVGKLVAGARTVLIDERGILTYTPGPGDLIKTGSRIRITGAENEGWERVNNNVFVVERPAEGDPHYLGKILLPSLNTEDLIEEGDVDASALYTDNPQGVSFTFSDEVSWQQEFQTSDITDRFYVYTLVSELGEEGPPSEPSELVSVGDGQVVRVETPTSITDPFQTYVFKRIYRTVPTTTGQARYFFVAEIPLSQEVFLDDLDVVELGEELPSLEWYPPPEGMQGMVPLPNGVMAGFLDRTLYLSEPYQPHAWPASYTKTMDNKIVGIAAFGQHLVVGTEENPYVGTATDPRSMTFSKLQTVEPCISKRAMQSLGYGVVYPSPNGLILVMPGGTRNVLEDVWDEKDWRAKFESYPEHFAAVHDGRYYLTFADPVAGISDTVIFDPKSDTLEITTLTRDEATGMLVDRDEDRLYWLATRDAPFGPRVLEWNPDDEAETLEATWRSKVFVAPHPLNMGAFQMFFDVAAAQASGNWPVLEVFAGGVSRATVTVQTEEPLRLPSGFLERDWQIEIRARVPVQSIYVAETVNELVGAMTT